MTSGKKFAKTPKKRNTDVTKETCIEVLWERFDTTNWYILDTFVGSRATLAAECTFFVQDQNFEPFGKAISYF